MRNMQDIMLNYPKYVEGKIVFEEIPDCVTLAVTISNCPFHCIGCHSSYLRDNVGKYLDNCEIDLLFRKNKGFNCFLFLGDSHKTDVVNSAKYIKENYKGIKLAIYSGYDTILPEYQTVFDYVKTGKFVEENGPLSSTTTNQRLYEIKDGKETDITYRFWKNYSIYTYDNL